MMKFKGSYDRFPKREKMNNPPYAAYMIPTVDEVDNVLSFMYADTILQILKGQAYYYGYECERHTDNEIHLASAVNGGKPISSGGRAAHSRWLDKASQPARDWYGQQNRLMRKAVKALARYKKIPMNEASQLMMLACEE